MSAYFKPGYDYIYGLFDPREPLDLSNCRYIGQASTWVRDTLRRHVGDGVRGVQTHKANWIRSLLSDDLDEPIIIVLEWTSDDTQEKDAREIAWIARGRLRGWRLTNIEEGGSVSPMTPETRAKISATRIERQIRHTPETLARIAAAKVGSEPWNKGLVGVYSDETRAKIREARALQTFSDETRQKLSDAGRGRVLTEDHKRKISESHKGISPTPEARAKISATLTGRKNGPMAEETKALLSEMFTGRDLGEEWLQHTREGAQRRWDEPGAREAYSELMSEVMANPEIRQRVSEGQLVRMELLRQKALANHSDSDTYIRANKTDKFIIGTRAEWKCQECGGPLDLTIPYRNDDGTVNRDSFYIRLIERVAKGDPRTYGNSQAVHFRCQ